MDVILIGSGGCMREVVWQMLESNKKNEKWNIVGYVDLNPADNGVYVCNKEVPYLGNDDYFDTISDTVNVVVSIAEPELKKKIVDKLSCKKNIKFPNVILNNTHICSDVEIGIGCVICQESILSTNVKLGNFVYCNMGVVVGHDDIIDDFVTLNPQVNISGNVKVGTCTTVGVGSTVIQGIKIGEYTVVGAGSVVFKDVPSYSTVLGVPAHVIMSRKI